MKRTAKLEYACRALLELSLHWPNDSPMQVSQIAHNQDIPIKFLVHILINLKQMGLVKSMRGKSGGYTLTTPPRDIKLSEIVTNFWSRLEIHEQEKEILEDGSVMDGVWREVDQALYKVMDKINFEEIANRERSRGKIPMYEI